MIFRTSRHEKDKEKPVEQGVAGYDPQAAAMHALRLAAHLWSTARGSSPER